MFTAQISRNKLFRYISKIRKYSKSLEVNLENSISKKASVPKTISPLVNLGQPAPHTHPHLLNNGEVTPGLKKEEYIQRRLKLLYKIKKYAINNKSSATNHMIIVPSSQNKYMSDKIPYVFRQNTDFSYLTGCLEPDSVLMLEINDKDHPMTTLFMREKDKHAELWDGPRTGTAYSPQFFGVDESYDISSFKTILENKISNTSTSLSIWYDKGNSPQSHLNEVISLGAKNQINNPTGFFHALRVLKSEAEVNLMRKTCEIASESFNEIMRETKVGDSEHHIFALMDFKCRMKNANYLAYPPVVASGNNATTIHYINNTQLTKKGDLVLMDAGCEYGGYTSDVTRTWPINGNFSRSQKILYDVVLTLEKDLIGSLMREGGDTLDNLFDTMCLRLGKYLQEVGLIDKSLEGAQLARVAYKFCPHHVSHYLGMDVHDTPLISRSTKLIPGMVCTVEPGIYIGLDRLDVPPEFRGIGVRVEDDVYIKSENEVEILTSNCIKDTNEIENLLIS